MILLLHFPFMGIFYLFLKLTSPRTILSNCINNSFWRNIWSLHSVLRYHILVSTVLESSFMYVFVGIYRLCMFCLLVCHLRLAFRFIMSEFVTLNTNTWLLIFLVFYTFRLNSNFPLYFSHFRDLDHLDSLLNLIEQPDSTMLARDLNWWTFNSFFAYASTIDLSTAPMSRLTHLDHYNNIVRSFGQRP